MTEYPAWSRLPVDLQHQYFEHARTEYLRCKDRLIEQAKKLREYKKLLKLEALPKGDAWKNWRIAAVDGSYSPNLSERVGARFGVYQAGYLIFNGDELSFEQYDSGKLSEEQQGDPEITRRIVRLLCNKLEREAALKCLKDDRADLVLIDGSLFAFRIGLSASGVRSYPIDVEGFETIGDLANYVRDITFELLRSGKVIGIIKRVRTAALDGYVLYSSMRHEMINVSSLALNLRREAIREIKRRKCIGTNDKAVLASIMSSNSWFAYERLPYFSLGGFDSFNRFIGECDKEPGSPDDVLKRAKEFLAAAVKRNLQCDPSEIKTSRYYVKVFAEAPPFCIEAKPQTDITEVLQYFSANCNPATGLPFPIDLVDENISVPEGFTREFMEEVEANLIRDEEMEGVDLSNFFMSINPQKEE